MKTLIKRSTAPPLVPPNPAILNPVASYTALRRLLATITALACTFWPAAAAEISLESAPPVVVKTAPVAGATDVDPALPEIRVTYSKSMQDRSWSWSTWGEENFPSMAGDPKYLEDQRTCVLPVKLEPGKFYAIWLNSDRFKNFKDSSGRPAVPYLLTFVTGPGSDRLSETTEAVKKAVTAISGYAEGDPRLEETMNSLRHLDQAQVVSALGPHLDSTTATIRRSAIYILWKGGFSDITPAATRLTQLLGHPEDLTRGMAALPLGQNRVDGSFEPLSAMLQKDSSGYARRCAAYALGWLGDSRAEPLLTAALEDSEAMVRHNAKYALGLLKNPSRRPAPGQLPPPVSGR